MTHHEIKFDKPTIACNQFHNSPDPTNADAKHNPPSNHVAITATYGTFQRLSGKNTFGM